MPRFRTALFAVALSTLAVAPVSAQDELSSCRMIPDLLADEAWGDLLYEIDICRGYALRARNEGAIDVLAVPLAGLQAGESSVESAMGVTIFEFEHGPFESTFTGGSGQAENPMGNVAALVGGLSGAFGVQQEGVEEVRLGRRMTGRLETDGDELTMTVSVAEGMLETSGTGTRDQLIELVRAIVEVLEDYFG
ncbi:MAG: hypothetical protein AAF389_13675 [Gemmatimonadota bacterium]